MCFFQEFSLTQDGMIQHLDLCITATSANSGSLLKLFQCRHDNPFQVTVVVQDEINDLMKNL